MRIRRLVDTMEVRTSKRQDLEGELLPPAETGRELIPWEEAELAAARRPAPLISISLPQLRADDDSDAPLMTWEKRTLQRTPSVETDFLLPVLQAGATAISVFVLAGLLSWALGWSWRVAAVTFGATLALTLLARLRFMDGLLWATETITGFDVNGDGKVGKPAASFTLANPAQARSDARQAQQTTESEAAKAELLAFLHRCYTVGTSEAAHGVKASGPDRQTYVRQRDVLLHLGIASWKNPERPKAGWKMAVSYARARELIARHVL